MKTSRWFLIAATTLTSPALAETGAQFTFHDIWVLAREHAPQIRAANHELEAARMNEARASRHWYPRVFAEGRAFATNDPALAFMSLLGQRRIEAPDFAPQALNQPGSAFFEHGTLGVDLPLFEGGAKVAAVEVSAKMTEARTLERRSAEISKYADLAQSYVSIVSLERQRSELRKLSSSVDGVISRYRIGAKSNPVGYSGLLGLKTLRNRLEGLLAENAARMESLREQVGVIAGGLPENWSPRSVDIKEFIATNLGSGPAGASAAPAAVQAQRYAADALEKARDGERARFLPKVGLFGSGDVFGGSRNTATSYAGGAYVQWDLFSASNFGATDQAEHTAAAAQARADGMSERARIERASAQQTAAAIERNLVLMAESANLLEEQTATARELFRNGSITALQLVEVLARRADLTVSRGESELGLAQARATLFVNSNVEGVPHEN